MRISFDVNMLADKEKTGIGWYATNIIKSFVETIDHEYLLNFLSYHMDFMAKKNILELARSENCMLQENSKVNRKIFKVLSLLGDSAYPYIFPDNADINHFFNFILPRGVKGKKVITIYDMVIKQMPETMKFSNRIILGKFLYQSAHAADAILTISQNSKNEIIEFLKVPEEKIFIAHPGVDQSVFHPNYDVLQVAHVKQQYALPEKYFLYVGTLEPRKNIERLIRAYYLLRQEIKNDCPALVLAGRKGWMYESIFQVVDELKLNDYVHFTGYVIDADVPVMMKGAFAFVYPSLYEGFGMPPLEAMACGVPVIVSNTSSLPEVVGAAGLQVNPFETEDIASAMFSIVEEKLLREKIAKLGSDRVAQFTWNRAVKEIDFLYNEIN